MTEGVVWILEIVFLITLTVLNLVRVVSAVILIVAKFCFQDTGLGLQAVELILEQTFFLRRRRRTLEEYYIIHSHSSMELVLIVGEEEKYFEFVSVSPNTNFHLLPDTGGHRLKTYRVQRRNVLLAIEMLNYFGNQSGVVPGLSISQVNKEVEVALGVGVLVKIALLQSGLLVTGDEKKNLYHNHN